MIHFALVASGSKGNCCIVQNEDSKIVIDCGATKSYLKQRFCELGFDHKTCDALFVTHAHIDHIAQLKLFEQVDTYAKCSLDTDFFHALEAFETVCINSLTIQEIPLSHDVDAVSGFIIEDQDSKLVYITDTGYVKEAYLERLKNADYYIFESNHDVEMLMGTRRPMYVKQRILGDRGHLCNEESAHILSQLIGENTKQIVLAHISEEGNSMELAKEVLTSTLKERQIAHDHIEIVAAPQFAIVQSTGK